MTTVREKDITEVAETSSDASDIRVYDPNFVKDHILASGAFEVSIQDLIFLNELLEDEEDIYEGLKALADEEGTVTWEQYQRQREEREPRGDLSG